MTTSPGVQERALLYSASTGASSRRLDRIVGRVRARDRGEVPWQTRRRRSVAAAKNKGSAREGEGRAHRPVAGSAGRGRPERRGRGSRQAERRTGLDGSVGGDTAGNSRPSQ